MPIGFLLAASLMVAPMADLTGWSIMGAAALAVGLPIFDTALVVVSRNRRGAQIFSGATDHTTHRLLGVLKTPRAVAGALGAIQAALCGLAIEATQLGPAAALAIAGIAVLLGAAAIIAIEWPTRLTPASDDA
jgi:UDP-GlcNAc:undecaprenyl-phosphate/decaprenyl-phosphate GlcNAc-1-phosphate transferase